MEVESVKLVSMFPHIICTKSGLKYIFDKNIQIRFLVTDTLLHTIYITFFYLWKLLTEGIASTTMHDTMLIYIVNGLIYLC